MEVGSDLWALNENMASSVSRLDFAEASGKRLPRALKFSDATSAIPVYLQRKSAQIMVEPTENICRSMDRDLLHYFHDFGDDGANSHQSWLSKLILKFFIWVSFCSSLVGLPTKVTSVC